MQNKINSIIEKITKAPKVPSSAVKLLILRDTTYFFLLNVSSLFSERLVFIFLLVVFIFPSNVIFISLNVVFKPVPRHQGDGMVIALLGQPPGDPEKSANDALVSFENLPMCTFLSQTLKYHKLFGVHNWSLYLVIFRAEHFRYFLIFQRRPNGLSRRSENLRERPSQQITNFLKSV